MVKSDLLMMSDAEPCLPFLARPVSAYGVMQSQRSNGCAVSACVSSLSARIEVRLYCPYCLIQGPLKQPALSYKQGNEIPRNQRLFIAVSHWNSQQKAYIVYIMYIVK